MNWTRTTLRLIENIGDFRQVIDPNAARLAGQKIDNANRHLARLNQLSGPVSGIKRFLTGRPQLSAPRIDALRGIAQASKLSGLESQQIARSPEDNLRRDTAQRQFGIARNKFGMASKSARLNDPTAQTQIASASDRLKAGSNVGLAKSASDRFRNADATTVDPEDQRAVQSTRNALGI